MRSVIVSIVFFSHWVEGFGVRVVDDRSLVERFLLGIFGDEGECGWLLLSRVILAFCVVMIDEWGCLLQSWLRCW